MTTDDLIHNTECPVCGSTDLRGLFEIQQVPVHCNLLWPSRDAARQAPRGDIRLGFCPGCGHLFNVAFEPGLMEYNQAYENSLHFSPRFQDYAQSLATDLIERHRLYNKDIIEIGCGKGDFLRLLCRLGQNRGVGFDPSYEPELDSAGPEEQVSFVQDFYSERYAAYQADLVCCRHVLEHIERPRAFLEVVRRAIGDRLDTVVFFELPNALYTLRDQGIWDLIYEHCSYYSASSLARLFAGADFKVVALAELYQKQFLGLEALPGANGQAEADRAFLAELTAYVNGFAAEYYRKVEGWQQELAQLAAAGKRVVVWGSGSKGVTFLNILQTQDQIAYVVDINPRKQGMYTAGTGQEIVAPDFLRHYRPDVIIVMNPIYKTEIEEMAAALGLSPQFLMA